MYSYFIFALVLIIIYIFFWKPSGQSEQQKGIEQAENERRRNKKNMIDVMKDQQEEFTCHFCGSTGFLDKNDFHIHIHNCNH